MKKLLCILATTTALAISPASAQDYPDGNVTIIVPFAAGGATDYFGRLAASYLSDKLDANFVVENRGGGAGNIGAGMVVTSDPDGKTLLLGAAGNIGINPALFPDLPYDPGTDLIAVAPIAGSQNVLVVHPSLPVNSVQDLIEYAKEQEGALNYASSGIGSTMQMAAELFKMQAGVEMTHIPYQGSGPAMVDLLTNRVPLMFDNIPSSLPHIEVGELKALGVTGSERSESLPDVPTIAEAGLADFSVRTWFGIFAPIGTPDEIVETLRTALTEMTQDPEIIEKIRARGSDPMIMTPEEFETLVKDDIAKWAIVVEGMDEFTKN